MVQRAIRKRLQFDAKYMMAQSLNSISSLHRKINLHILNSTSGSNHATKTDKGKTH